MIRWHIAAMKTFCLAVMTLLGLVFPAEAATKPVLIVLTNHGQLGDTGKPTGFYLSEAAHPWEVFTKAGLNVSLASPKGGFAPVDPKSLDLKDAANEAFWKKYGSETAKGAGIADTLALGKVKPEDYSAIFFAGGHGTMWDFPESKAVKKVTAAIYEQGGVVGAVCHGPAALAEVKLKDGTPLVKGRTVAVFTDEEEKAVELTEVVPFLLQTRLASLGATVKTGKNFQENAVADGRLVTGQNPASATKAAQLVVKVLGNAP